MSRPSLAVIIPTRNRPDSLLRLLKSLAVQRLSPQEFEVVVVDDGSEPPLDASRLTKNAPFVVRLIRRVGPPGAHESRFAGLGEASAERVLFLDDDVIPEPELLAEHAAIHGIFAIGPILYHPVASTTPYQRFGTKRYAAYADALLREGSDVPASSVYICNASGPTDLFLAIFERVRALVGDAVIPADGCDEELLDYELRKHKGVARLLPNAVVLHVNTKTLEQVRRERRLHGKMQCHLMLRFPEMRASFDSYPILTGNLVSYRSWRLRLFWMAPRMFRLIANAFTFLADRGPARWVPAWACYPPLAIAFWDGVNSVAPSYSKLRADLLVGSGVD